MNELQTLPLLEVANEGAFRGTVLCPNCWHKFPLESVLWIAVHSSLKGDPQLPARLATGEEQKRFIAERFTPDGRAIDERGSPCTQLACPRCHLLIPRASTELPSITLSLLGAPGSGKSLFLSSMTFTMRQRAMKLGLRFQDADLTLNRLLCEDEAAIFLSGSGYRDVDQAVGKTQTSDENRYRISKIAGSESRFVTPFTFLLGPSHDHPKAAQAVALSRLLCLYDNAGEHFQPGADPASTPMTGHLASSQGLIYTFDPTKDHRFRTRMRRDAIVGPTAARQDQFLVEAANRIREHAGIPTTVQIDKPLIIVLTKFDTWKDLLRGFDGASLLRDYPGTKIQALFADKFDELSRSCEDLLNMLCPEIVATARGISREVRYCPIAAIGWDVQKNPKSGVTQFRSDNCDPYGVLTPLLYLLNKSDSQLVPTLRAKRNVN